MTNVPKLVVVTGAHSYLGAQAVEALLDETDCQIAAMTTPWAVDVERPPEPSRVERIAVDLSAPFDASTTALFASAERVLHFAWIRGKNEHYVGALNEAIADRILDTIRHPQRFVFVSSTAASKDALSTYARTKWRVAHRVRERGGTVLVCGLVLDAPARGPYAILRRVVAGLPLAIRLRGREVPVYTVHMGDLRKSAVVAADRDLAADSYRVFAQSPIDLNRLLSNLENELPRLRIPLPLPGSLVIGAARCAKTLGLPPVSLIDRVLTFLVKDSALLATTSPLPDVGFQAYETTNDTREGR